MTVCYWSRIPKTASTSLHNRLMDGIMRTVDGGPVCLLELPRAIVLTCGHTKPHELVSRGLLREDTLRRGIVFSVVRNPWARFASLWFGIGKDHRWTNSFESFVLDSLSDKTITASAEGTPIGSTMDEWLLLDGIPLCELVLRMERIDEDFPALATRLGIDPSPLGTSNAHQHQPYMEIHTTATIDAIAEAEAWSIERFGYRFGDDSKMEMEMFQETAE